MLADITLQCMFITTFVLTFFFMSGLFRLMLSRLFGRTEHTHTFIMATSCGIGVAVAVTLSLVVMDNPSTQVYVIYYLVVGIVWAELRLFVQEKLEKPIDHLSFRFYLLWWPLDVCGVIIAGFRQH